VPEADGGLPLVTVILNSYNQARWLPDAVESVLSQTFTDWELIAIDNGSTDRSADILAGYADDPRIIVRAHADNQPITKRFNEGVTAARGRLVSFLYSDDYYLRDKLARQVAAFAQLPLEIGVVYAPGSGRNELTGVRWTQPFTSVEGRGLRRLLETWHDTHLDMISPMFRKECLELHPFYEDLFAEGEGIALRIALTHGFHFIDEPVAVNRDTGANAGKALQANAKIAFETLVRLGRDPRFPDEDRDALETQRRDLLRAYGWQAVRLSPDVSWARACLLGSVTNQPRRLLDPKVLLGLALSFLPTGLRGRMNDVATKVRGDFSNAAHVEGFAGSGD
jgi:glycosyltransferase involved in cell wall biosynthesis